MVKEKPVRYVEAMKLIELIRERLASIEKALREEAYIDAESEALIAYDLFKSLKITIRRLERL